MLSYTFFKREKIPEKEESKMKNVTRSVRFVLSMVLVMAMVLTSIGSFGTEAKQFIDFLKSCGFTYWQVLPFCIPASALS